MNHPPQRRTLRQFGLVLSVVLTPLILISAVLIGFRTQALASSHREAPLISKDPYADNTDTYVFISPENPNNLVLIGSWIPFEGPEGGPNYFEWDDNALYDLYVDNNGDAKADVTYTLSSKVKVNIPTTFLYNVGTLTGLTDPDWNRQQFITVTETTDTGAVTQLIANQPAAPVNIGEKSTPNYVQTLESAAIRTFSNGGDTGKVFAGQTDDAFWVDLQVFDLLTLRGKGNQPLKAGGPPPGYPGGYDRPTDSVSAFNVHSLVVEVPISRLKQGGTEPVIGMWAGTRRPTMRVLEGLAGLGTQTNSGAPVQVSRLGMPLVNEVVIPMALKDAFNTLRPEQDLFVYSGGAGPLAQQILQKSVEDPEIGNLLCGLYGVPMPADANDDCQTEFTVGTPRSGRGDIFDIFLTGFKLAAPFTINTANGPVTLPAGTNVNQPTGAVPAEMIRINTDLKGAVCSPTPSRLGVLGGDACGFPNGRRLTDDTVEIELLAVAGAAYQVIDGRDASFTFNPALIGILDDGVNANDVPFRTTFPYMAPAQSGQAHWHLNPFYSLLAPWIMGNPAQ